MERRLQKPKIRRFRLPIVFFDIIVFLISYLLMYAAHQGAANLDLQEFIIQTSLVFFFIFGGRFIGKIYKQIWRYGGIQPYIRLLMTDTITGALHLILEILLPIQNRDFVGILGFYCMNTLGSLTIRMGYRYAYKYGYQNNRKGSFLRFLLRVFSCGTVCTELKTDDQKNNIAIIGAGNVGICLAEELLSSKTSHYVVRCFIDNDPQKIGKNIHGITVLSEGEATLEILREHQIHDVVFAIPDMEQARKLEFCNYYQNAGFRIKTYDFPIFNSAEKNRLLRDFSIEDLLMRDEKVIINDQTRNYYAGKVILITGGGGSIGSELCRQLAKMAPKQLIILDIYENCAYEQQQAMKMDYGDKLDVRIEIVSITNKQGLSRVFQEYHPDICIHAAAHKHVPLMEKNCIEAVENNVFGTLNVIECCEQFECSRFIMVSTDKAVNPTSVMGATKRVCEMIMQAYSTKGNVTCSATRFGNVLGSAGSVIPIFRRQISSGGPVTLTDKRIVRYFMTISEASQLILISGSIAKNGELFVLDMGEPVKIYDLARSMINLSGVNDIEIIETGLRPGEKLYEELLVKKDTMETTTNKMIFIEHENPINIEKLAETLVILKNACEKNLDEAVCAALHEVVLSYHNPEEFNREYVEN